MTQAPANRPWHGPVDQDEDARSLARMVAHEVKNAVAGIGGALTILVARAPANSPERRVLVESLRRLRSLDCIAEDLCSYTQPSAPELAPVQLRETLDSVMSGLRHDGHRERVFLLTGEGALVQGDERQLATVFRNLLRNASEASPGNAPVQACVIREAGRVRVEVADQGNGIPPEVRDTLFRPYVTTKTSGAGLGLAVARRIVEAHGGHLDCERTEDGRTVFRVTLPSGD